MWINPQCYSACFKSQVMHLSTFSCCFFGGLFGLFLPYFDSLYFMNTTSLCVLQNQFCEKRHRVSCSSVFCEYCFGAEQRRAEYKQFTLKERWVIVCLHIETCSCIMNDYFSNSYQDILLILRVCANADFFNKASYMLALFVLCKIMLIMYVPGKASLQNLS